MPHASLQSEVQAPKNPKFCRSNLEIHLHTEYPCSPCAHRLRETTATTEPLTGIGALGSDLCRKQNSFIDEHEGQLLLASTADYRLRLRANCVAHQR